MIKKKDPNQEDKKTWQEYIKNPSDIYDKDQDAFRPIQEKGRDKLDLHGFTLDEANTKVKEIIEHCIKNKFRELSEVYVQFSLEDRYYILEYIKEYIIIYHTCLNQKELFLDYER